MTHKAATLPEGDAPDCRCGLYAGACPLHDHDYRADAERAIAIDRLTRRAGAVCSQLHIGDEVDVDNGPILGGGTERWFVVGIYFQREGHIQVSIAKPDASVGGAPAYAMKPTGRTWSPEEKSTIIAYINARDDEDRELRNKRRANE